MTLYDKVMNSKPIFNSPEEALEFYTKEYYELTAKYGKSGHEFWLEAERSSQWSEDYSKILTLARNIGMARYQIEKNG